MKNQKDTVWKDRAIRVAVIGGGASGLMAAIEVARVGAQVVVLEQKDRTGKKILATGNGHCNFTNRHLDASCYHNNPFALHIIEQFSVEDTLDFFKKIGVYPVEKNGYYYPASQQASAVADLLEQEAKRLGAAIETGCRVTGIRKEKEEFILSVDRTIYSQVKETVKKNGKKKKHNGPAEIEHITIKADRVILAGGGLASPALGSDGSCYDLAKALGHTIHHPFPALTGIRCAETWFPELAGVRISARVELMADRNVAAAAEGELQLTDYGISGIPVFQISRYAALHLYEGRTVQVRLLFFPDISDEEIRKYMNSHEKNQYQGLFPDKLLKVLLKENKTGKTMPRELFCTCTEVNGFDRAQVTCGGVCLDQVDSETLESAICPGLFLAGELLDVDGICGGYNLQWAWSSGHVAGRSAAEKRIERKREHL